MTLPEGLQFYPDLWLSTIKAGGKGSFQHDTHVVEALMEELMRESDR